MAGAPGADEGILSQFDFSAIEEMDPSLSGGHRVIYDREVPFELRVQQVSEVPQEVGTLEAVRVKILILGDDQAPGVIKVELTSENDLFFHYTHSLDEQGFRLVQEQQKLMVDFAEYPTVLIRMLNTCIKEPLQHLAVFVMQRGGRAHLDFIQNMEYKFVELLSTAFVASDEETVRQNITFRYNSVKSRLALMQAPPASPPRRRATGATSAQRPASTGHPTQRATVGRQARLQDINALVKIKNPSLLLQLQRTHAARVEKSAIPAALAPAPPCWPHGPVPVASEVHWSPAARQSAAIASRTLSAASQTAPRHARESEPSPLSTIRPLRFPTSSSRSLAP